jgi:4-amino-4-deoxy-L-arabinose transferase-like glycosyltransferase
MTIRFGAHFISIVLLGLLAIVGLFLVLHATPEGLGLTDDSIGYIAGARSMLAGHGYREAWLATNGPVTHFPPAYPAVLTFLGWFGLEPLRGARFLNAVLFGLNLVLLGILGWRMTRSLVAGLVLAGLFLVNDSLLRVHSMALSEPLFIFLSLLAFWMIDLYFERDAHWLWLVACGAFVGMAYLTRYAALALAGTFLIALTIWHDTWRRRLISMGILTASLLPSMVGWAVRNDLVGGTVTNRILVWHPVTAGSFETALRTISSFLMPVEPWRAAWFKVPGLFLGIVALILVAVAIWLGSKVKERFATPRAVGQPAPIAFTNALYVFGYLVSILVAISFFDASTKFKLRILSPIYVSILILLVALGTWAWRRRREVVIVVGLIIFGLSAYGQVAAVNELAKSGQGFASFKWYDSKAMAFLRGLSPNVMIYTNDPGAVYLYTGRGAFVLPDRVDPVTAEARPGFDRGLSQLQSDIHSGKAVLALFSGGDTPAPDAAILSSGLYLAEKSAGAEVYTGGR